MRRKPTINNLGAFNEAVFVCTKEQSEYLSKVAHTLTYDYGIRSEVFAYDVENAFTKQVLRLLRRSYHIIFIVDSQTIISATSAGGEKHPFRKAYEYVKRYNRYAISCATFEKHPSPQLNSVEFPKSMRGFNALHRKYFETISPAKTAREIEPELRRHYPRRQRSAMRYIVRYNSKNEKGEIVSNGINEFTLFYKHHVRKNTFALAWYAVAIAILNAFLPSLIESVGEPYSIALTLLFVITCVFAPIVGLYLVINRNTTLNFDKRYKLKREKDVVYNNKTTYGKSKHDFELERKQLKIEEKRKLDSISRSNFMTVCKYLLCVILLFIVAIDFYEVGFEYLSIVYAACAAYLFISHEWAKRNLLWLKECRSYMEYAMMRHKALKHLKPLRIALPIIFVLAGAAAVYAAIFKLSSGDIQF